MSTQTHEHAHSHAAGSCCGSGSSCSSGSQAHHTHEPLFQPQPAPRQYATDPTATEAVIRLTDKAATEVKRFMVEKNVPADCVLRVALQGGGCSGFEPHLGFDNRISAENDIITEQYGIRVAIDKKFVMFMNGTTIDYLDGIDRRGFKFDNPNATSTCGCGKSFSV